MLECAGPDTFPLTVHGNLGDGAEAAAVKLEGVAGARLGQVSRAHTMVRCPSGGACSRVKEARVLLPMRLLQVQLDGVDGAYNGPRF
jgi:hypothetical protein